MTILTHKKCKACGGVKPVSEFGVHYTNKDGLRTKCKICRREEYKTYYGSHKEQTAERSRQWHANNPEKVAQKQKKWISANREKVKALKRKYYHLDPRKHLDRLKAWVSGNRDKILQYRQKRRALKNASGGVITAREWQALKEFYDFTCLRCGRREPKIKLTLDHVIPLKLGGSNTIENAQPLCGSCNCSKGAKVADYR